jgi:hypothetical protein
MFMSFQIEKHAGICVKDVGEIFGITMGRFYCGMNYNINSVTLEKIINSRCVSNI